MSKKGASIRWSQAQLDAYKNKAAKPAALPSPFMPNTALPASPLAGMQALGRMEQGKQNKTEAEYDAHLAADPSVLWFAFEAVKFRLADNTYYTPDFLVMRADRTLEVHEVKGFWTDDARVKIKVAAELFPIFKFVALKKKAKKDGGGWSQEEF